MAVTGLMRDGLTAREEAHAVSALFDAKMSGAAIGRALGRSTASVKTARRAAALSADVSESTDYPLTLDQMAILADWQDDPEATEMLLRAAPRGQMEHVVAQLQADAVEHAAREAALAPVIAEFTAAGVTVLNDEPSATETGSEPRSLEDLAPGDAPTGDRYTPETHATCPGHAVWLTAEYYPAEPDEDTPEEVEVSQTFLCLDPAGHGHVSHHWYDRNEPHGYRRPGVTAPVAQSDADRAAAEQAAAAAKSEALRTLIRRNKEALAAQTVRREFLHRCMTVKSRQKKMTAWALARVVLRDSTHRTWQGSWHSTSVLGELLGVDRADQEIRDAAPARHPLLLWAQVVAAYEDDFPKDAHRQDSADRADYLRHMKDIGYTLADVDQLVIDTARPRWNPNRAAPATAEPVVTEPEANDDLDQAPADGSAGDDTAAPPADEVAGETDSAAYSAGNDDQEQEVPTD